jgi:thiamine phosphate phosphatase / amino-HMP aminohydrolase
MPLHLILDFDSTITMQDSIGFLAAHAIDFHSKEDPGPDFQSKWANIRQQYARDYADHVASYVPPKSARTSVDEESRFLSSLRAVELRSLERVEAAGLFRNVFPDLAAAKRLGRAAVGTGRVIIRSGFHRMLDKVFEDGGDVSIISINWSAAFIEGVIDNPKVKVVANDLSEAGTILGPTILDRSRERKMVVAQDKLEVMGLLKQLRANTVAPPNHGSILETTSVAMGDSMTDLLCVLDASRGIIITDIDDTKLIEELQTRFGFEFAHVSKMEQVRLNWATNFDEVVGAGILDKPLRVSCDESE